jgi:hypothetical protein
VTEDGSGPTPVLVTGAERRCYVITDPDPDAGRPRGLYGNEFSAADEEVVRRATVHIDPPTVTNIIAMAAPSYRSGRYARDTIERVLVTAYTGFAAAVAESEVIGGAGAPTAGMAGVDRLVYHTVSAEGSSPLQAALAIVRDDLAPAGELGAAELVDRIDAMAFEWGTSDGT